MRRLLQTLALLVLALSGLTAHAAFTLYKTDWQPSKLFSSKTAACEYAKANSAYGNPANGAFSVSVSGMACQITAADGLNQGSVVNGFGLTAVEQNCATGQVWSEAAQACAGNNGGGNGGGKSCPSQGAKNAAEQIAVLDGLTKAQAMNVIRAAGLKAAVTCQDGCEVSYELAICGGTTAWHCEISKGTAGVKSCDGTELDAPPAPPATPTNNPPPPGTCPGEVNGVTVYRKCDQTATSTGSVTTSVTGTSTEGGGTGTGTTTTSTTSTTVCDNSPSGQQNGGCTTTTSVTKTNPDGSTESSSVTSNQTTDGFCKANPLDKQCKGGAAGNFGGSCDAAFTCDGDPVSCAVATSVNQSRCMLKKAFDNDTNTDSLALKAAAGTDESSADKLRSAAAAAPVNISSLDQNGKGWARTCPDDPSFALPWTGGRSFSIPFSRVCSPLALFANAAVGVTLLASLLWVINGRKT